MRQRVVLLFFISFHFYQSKCQIELGTTSKNFGYNDADEGVRHIAASFLYNVHHIRDFKDFVKSSETYLNDQNQRKNIPQSLGFVISASWLFMGDTDSTGGGAFSQLGAEFGLHSGKIAEFNTVNLRADGLFGGIKLAAGINQPRNAQKGRRIYGGVRTHLKYYGYWFEDSTSPALHYLGSSSKATNIALSFQPFVGIEWYGQWAGLFVEIGANSDYSRSKASLNILPRNVVDYKKDPTLYNGGWAGHPSILTNVRVGYSFSISDN